MKRLLCILNSLNAGGAENFLLKIAREWFKEDQYRMDFIVTAEEKGELEDEAMAYGCIIYHTSMHTQRPVKTFFGIKNIVKNNDYQYVLKLCNTPLGIFDLLASRFGGACKVGARSCNAATQDGVGKRFFSVLLRPFFNALCDYRLAPSDLAAVYTFGKHIVQHDGVFILHNALDCAKYKYSEEARESIRQELGVGSAFIIGHIGRFSNQKNHSFLIDVFVEVVKEYQNVVLVLVGKGELEEDIRELCKNKGIQGKVIFTGVRKDVPNLLSAFDVFVLPSLYEGMPNTVIEAQATGLKCIISNTITRQADILGIVEYCDIQNITDWKNAILNSRFTSVDRKKN